jgi:hypothetical protein
MMRQDKKKGIWLFSAKNLHLYIFLITALAFFVPSSSASGSQAMITQFSGSGFVYNNSSPDKTRLLPFMKLHDGDRISLLAGAQLQLIYFSNARKEVWRGPADFTVHPDTTGDKVSTSPSRENRESQYSNKIDPSRLQTAGVETVRGLSSNRNKPNPEPNVWREPAGFVSGAAPSKRQLNPGCETVTQLPAAVSRELQRISRIIDPSLPVHNDIKGNGHGENNNKWVTLKLSPANSLELTQAENIYKELKKKLPDNDVTAELFLFSVLSRNRKFSEMEDLLSVMQKKQPGNQSFTYLSKWLKSLQ